MAGNVPPGGMPFQGQPSPEQIQQIQQQFFQEAARRGLTPQQFGEQLKAQAQAHQAQQGQQNQQQGQQHQQHQHSHGHTHGPNCDHDHDDDDDSDEDDDTPPQLLMQQQQRQVPIQPGPPKPEALAVAEFLKNQNLKSRVCILQEKRRDMFKVKRAIRALQSPAYEKARKKKNSVLPEVTDRASAEAAFKLLPMSMLAIRVSRFNPDNNPPHGQPGHQHGVSAAKGKKGQWVVRIEQHQDTEDQSHYAWFYEGAQWQQKLYAVGALLAVIALVMFPLWPYTLRRGVWYLSMASLGLLGAFFGLAIVRLILFLITIVAVPPGIWLYPNLFEDVGFFDSFRPVWAWRETKESLAAKKRTKKEKKRIKRAKAAGVDIKGIAKPPNGTAPPAGTSDAPADIPIASKTGATGAAANEGIAAGTSVVTERRNMQARVEEVEEE